MGDYSFAEKIKFVPTLRSRTSPAEYYDWEDAMEDFLHGRGLESHMKMHFVKHIFSNMFYNGGWNCSKDTLQEVRNIAGPGKV